jgi:hypothetical protein
MEELYNIPNAVKRRHDTDEQHHKSQWLCMGNEPASNEQSHGRQNRSNRKPISSRPPQREQKANTQDYAGDLARHDIKPAEYEKCTDEGGSKISGWECDRTDSSLHVCNSAFAWVEGDGLDAPTGTAGCYGVSEFVEGNDQHLRIDCQQEITQKT